MDDHYGVRPLPKRWLTAYPAGMFGIPAELAHLECAIYQ